VLQPVTRLREELVKVLGVCVCVCVCVHICTYIHICILKYVRTYICMYVCVCLPGAEEGGRAHERLEISGRNSILQVRAQGSRFRA